MVYAGYINKNIVAGLQGLNCMPIGLCGVDGQGHPRGIKEVSAPKPPDRDSNMEPDADS